MEAEKSELIPNVKANADRSDVISSCPDSGTHGNLPAIRRSLNLPFRALLVFVALFGFSTEALSYDLPEVIGVLHGIDEDSMEFGREFCWAGTQNDDIYDDLLVGHDPRFSDARDYVNAVKLYFGGEEIDNEPGLVFTTEEHERFGDNFAYLGRLTADNEHWIAISSAPMVGNDPVARKLYLYRGGDELDAEPDIVMQQDKSDALYLGDLCQNRRPADFNGDGYHDLLMARWAGDGMGEALIFYGGEEFDTIPDWSSKFTCSEWLISAVMFITGGDLNNDNCDEFVLNRRDPNNDSWFGLYLGGSPMDTVMAWDIQALDYENRALRYRAHSFLPDVNGDNFDEWGVYYRLLDSENDGCLVFFGSESPDDEPDLDLEGNHRHGGHDGVISGGDFNNDGIGDIVSGLPEGYMWGGEIHLYFGSKWIDPSTDILINGEEDYGEEFGVIGRAVGAIGDYNGDDVLDFAMTRPQGVLRKRKLFIFAGSEDWQVSVEPDDVSLPSQWRLFLSPNPFNSVLKVSLSAPNGAYELRLIDTIGRIVWSDNINNVNSETYTTSINADNFSTGVYVLICQNLSSYSKDKLYIKAVLIR